MAGLLNVLIKYAKKLKFNCIFYTVLYAMAVLTETITTTFGLSSQDYKNINIHLIFRTFFKRKRWFITEFMFVRPQVFYIYSGRLGHVGRSMQQDLFCVVKQSHPSVKKTQNSA